MLRCDDQRSATTAAPPRCNAAAPAGAIYGTYALTPSARMRDPAAIPLLRSLARL